MTYADVVARAWEDERLFSVLVELTYRCDLDCAFCYNDRAKRGRPLSLGQYERLLDDLAGMQVLNVVLSGGEPLAHPEFFAIGRRARDRGFVVRVKTNGSAVGPEVAARLRDEVDPFGIDVSLHGARPETHDRQTRTAGSFGRLVSNLAAMRAAGLRVRINAVVTKWNEDEVEGMLGLAEDLGLPIRFDPAVTPRDDGDLAPLELAASGEGLARLFALQRSRAEAARRASSGLPGETDGAAFEVSQQGDDVAGAPSTTKHCGAGSSTVAIDPYGNVFPCVQWRTPVGSLHEAGIREIWETSAAIRGVRHANAEVKSRLAVFGADAPLLAHCPGLAAQRSGGDPAWISPAQLSLLDARRPAREGGLALPALERPYPADRDAEPLGRARAREGQDR